MSMAFLKTAMFIPKIVPHSFHTLSNLPSSGHGRTDPLTLSLLRDQSLTPLNNNDQDIKITLFTFILLLLLLLLLLLFYWLSQPTCGF
jgi:hypothetical protein